MIAFSGIGVVKRVSDSTDGEHYVRYQYAGRMGGGSGTPAYHIVDVARYEAAGIELINAASGDSVLIGGPPILSPDGSRFATTSENAERCESVAAATRTLTLRQTGQFAREGVAVRPTLGASVNR